MSLFENISFLNEARTKEEYLAQKAKEKEEAKRKEQEHFKKRYNGDLNRLKLNGIKNFSGSVGNKYNTSEYFKNTNHTIMEPGYFKKSTTDDKRRSDIDIEMKKDLENINTANISDIKNSNAMQKADAKNRYRRRHYNECNIFEYINFI